MTNLRYDLKKVNTGAAIGQKSLTLLSGVGGFFVWRTGTYKNYNNQVSMRMSIQFSSSVRVRVPDGVKFGAPLE